MRLKTTAGFERWWRARKIDWAVDYGSTVDHPHRDLIIETLRPKKFGSLMEAGCASGPNLVRIRRAWPNIQLGGADVCEKAIEAARKVLPDGIFDVRPVHNLFFSDKSVDISLTDACLIYVGPLKIKKALSELKRVSRKGIVLCEFHSDSWWARQVLRLASGYNSYDWPKLLESAGFYDVSIRKIPKKAWPGTPWEQFGYIITASVPALL